MKIEIKAFIAGVCASMLTVFFMFFRRKKNISNRSRVQSNYDPAGASENTVRRIQERTESGLSEVERGIEESIDILHRARKRMEEEGNTL